MDLEMRRKWSEVEGSIKLLNELFVNGSFRIDKGIPTESLERLGSAGVKSSNIN
jgi:hypothetical protein